MSFIGLVVEIGAAEAVIKKVKKLDRKESKEKYLR